MLMQKRFTRYVTILEAVKDPQEHPHACIKGKCGDENKVHNCPWIQLPVNRDRRYSSWADSGESETPV